MNQEQTEHNKKQAVNNPKLNQTISKQAKPNKPSQFKPDQGN
jgi:hypothetical protein